MANLDITMEVACYYELPQSEDHPLDVNQSPPKDWFADWLTASIVQRYAELPDVIDPARDLRKTKAILSFEKSIRFSQRYTRELLKKKKGFYVPPYSWRHEFCDPNMFVHLHHFLYKRPPIKDLIVNGILENPTREMIQSYLKNFIYIDYEVARTEMIRSGIRFLRPSEVGEMCECMKYILCEARGLPKSVRFRTVSLADLEILANQNICDPYDTDKTETYLMKTWDLTIIELRGYHQRTPTSRNIGTRPRHMHSTKNEFQFFQRVWSRIMEECIEPMLKREKEKDPDTLFSRFGWELDFMKLSGWMARHLVNTGKWEEPPPLPPLTTEPTPDLHTTRTTESFADVLPITELGGGISKQKDVQPAYVVSSTTTGGATTSTGIVHTVNCSSYQNEESRPEVQAQLSRKVSDITFQLRYKMLTGPGSQHFSIKNDVLCVLAVPDLAHVIPLHGKSKANMVIPIGMYAVTWTTSGKTKKINNLVEQPLWNLTLSLEHGPRAASSYVHVNQRTYVVGQLLQDEIDSAHQCDGAGLYFCDSIVQLMQYFDTLINNIAIDVPPFALLHTQEDSLKRVSRMLTPAPVAQPPVALPPVAQPPIAYPHVITHPWMAPPYDPGGPSRR